MSDKQDGHASAAAQEADAVDEVTRNTKSQTAAASYTTTDHDVIRAWAEARGARPATVAGTQDPDGSASGGGLLRIGVGPADAPPAPAPRGGVFRGLGAPKRGPGY